MFAGMADSQGRLRYLSGQAAGEPDLTLGVTCKASRGMATRAGGGGDSVAGPRDPGVVVRDDGVAELRDRRDHAGLIALALTQVGRRESRDQTET